MEIINFKNLPDTTTPITATNLNNMQRKLLTHKYHLIVTAPTPAGGTVTLPCYYQVGQSVLDVFLNGERLLLSSDDAGTDGHYVEVGEANAISNKIKLTTDWNASTGDVFEFVVRGVYESET